MKRKLNEYEDDCYEEKRICIYYKKVFLIASEPVLCPLCCDLIKNEATTSCNHNFCMIYGKCPICKFPQNSNTIRYSPTLPC